MRSDSRGAVAALVVLVAATGVGGCGSSEPSAGGPESPPAVTVTADAAGAVEPEPAVDPAVEQVPSVQPVQPVPSTVPGPSVEQVPSVQPAPGPSAAPEPAAVDEPSAVEEPPTQPEPSAAPPPSAEPAPEEPEDDGVLRQGESGEAVLAAQQRLADLGYWLGAPDGSFGPLTTQAVMALQKAAGISRDGVLGPRTQQALADGVRAQARGSDGVEIDLDRQLLLVVRGGEVRYAINTSTGKDASWPTPTGDYRVQRAIDGMRHAPLGELWRPRYYDGGIAVHGSPNIPAYPASHGCARVSNAAMDMIWAEDLMPIGSPVRVY